MNDRSALISPRIVDREMFREFADSLTDKAPTIERDVARLRRNPEDRELVADLFRALHNIKGDAAICRVEIGVMIAHPIETALARVRSGEIRFSDLLAEAILLAVDRLELAVEAMNADRPVAPLKLPALVEQLELLAKASPASIDSQAAALVEQVTGFRPVVTPSRIKPASPSRGASDTAEDLKYFRQLATQLETRSSLYKGRTGRLLRLAAETNREAGQPVDPVQLEAAVCMHDIGMMFLPEATWLKVGRLSDEDKRALRAHPEWAAGLLERMPGWEGAAQMIREHHEMPDGGGYPRALKGAEICPGAKILAIVDAFEAVMLKHSHRGQSRSLLRAIAEINACDNQFAPEWIVPFNAVIRTTLEG